MAGSEGGPGKRAGRNPGTAPWSDPYAEPLAGKLRKGSAGSNTVADHLDVLAAAITALPRRSGGG